MVNLRLMGHPEIIKESMKTQLLVRIKLNKKHLTQFQGTWEILVFQ